jgi:hypothetical protein
MARGALHIMEDVEIKKHAIEKEYTGAWEKLFFI